jgi:plastocyanin
MPMPTPVQTEPEQPSVAVQAPTRTAPATAPRLVEQARGSIGGSVLVRDRGGKEKGDRADVVIYLEQVPRKYQALKKPRAMAQRDKAFVPKLIAVTKGSTVDFPNEDKFFHNVFSLSEGNTFDLGLYRSGESKPMVFEKTGVVDVYCNIHPNMWAQILVLDNPFFTTSSSDGTFELSKVPPGTYSVAAWVSGGGDPVKQQVKVEPGKRVELKFEVREGSSNKPHLNKFNQPYDRYK